MMKAILLSLIGLFACTGLGAVLEPAGCLSQKQTPCLIKTQKKPEVFRWQESSLWLSGDSMVELRAGGIVQLLQGQLWLQAKTEGLAFESVYVKGFAQGDVWLLQTPEHTTVRRLSGELSLFAKAKPKSQALPAGFENWYAGLDSNLEIRQGVVRPLQLSKTLAEWVKSFRVPLKVARPQWSQWSEGWKGNVELSSSVYKEATLRSLASVEEKNRRAEALARARAKEQAELRQVFRSKNGIESYRLPTQGPNSQDF